MSKRVTVLAGGWSSEREVSLVSGKACAEALEQSGYIVTRLDPPRDIAKLSAALTPPPDIVFNALHGQWGEDGIIQAVLDIMEIPYTHSPRVASTLAMNKPVANTLFKAAGIPVAKNIIFPAEKLGTYDPLPRPYVIKPTSDGSSVDVHIIEDGTAHPDYGRWCYSDAMAEEYIPGHELSASVMGTKALGVTELRPLSGFYDYEAKYSEGKTKHLCPAPIPAEVSMLCTELAIKAHNTLGCRGFTRSDFRYDASQDRLVLLELNTQPGMTPLSLGPEQAAYMGISFKDLVCWMVEDAQ